MATTSIEERLRVLEFEVTQLKERILPDVSQPEATWWKKIVGVYRDDPEFEEAMRLGREYRESLRPTEDEENFLCTSLTPTFSVFWSVIMWNPCLYKCTLTACVEMRSLRLS